MGASLSWLAVKACSAATTLTRLSLEQTGSSAPHASGRFNGIKTGNWYVMLMDRCDHAFVRKPTLQKISLDSEVIALSAEEHVMWSSIELWSHGKCVWSVKHNGDISCEHLDEDGDLPSIYATIKKAKLEAQALEDKDNDLICDHAFEVPLELGQSITGFRYDDGIEGFEVLKKKPSPGLFSQLFGRK